MATKPLKKLRRKKVTGDADVVYPELENLRARFKFLQMDGLENRKEFLAVEAAIIAFCQRKGIEKYDRGPGASITPVQGHTEVVDWNGIQEKLTPDQWKAILDEPQPSRSKLSAMLETGQVKPQDVTEYITEKPSKPYVKLT